MNRRFSQLVVVLIAALTGALTSAGAASTSTLARENRAVTAAPRANLAAARLRLRLAASGLNSPVAIAWRAGDRRMYVAEQGPH